MGTQKDKAENEGPLFGGRASCLELCVDSFDSRKKSYINKNNSICLAGDQDRQHNYHKYQDPEMRLQSESSSIWMAIKEERGTRRKREWAPHVCLPLSLCLRVSLVLLYLTSATWAQKHKDAARQQLHQIAPDTTTTTTAATTTTTATPTTFARQLPKLIAAQHWLAANKRASLDSRSLVRPQQANRQSPASSSPILTNSPNTSPGECSGGNLVSNERLRDANGAAWLL